MTGAAPKVLWRCLLTKNVSRSFPLAENWGGPWGGVTAWLHLGKKPKSCRES